MHSVSECVPLMAIMSIVCASVCSALLCSGRLLCMLDCPSLVQSKRVRVRLCSLSRLCSLHMSSARALPTLPACLSPGTCRVTHEHACTCMQERYKLATGTRVSVCVCCGCVRRVTYDPCSSAKVIVSLSTLFPFFASAAAAAAACGVHCGQ